MLGGMECGIFYLGRNAVLSVWHCGNREMPNPDTLYEADK
jgi:hypothetical protein